MELRVDGERMRADFEAVSAFGATGTGGVDRPTFSPAHLAARAWFLERGRDAGLEVGVDRAANHSVRLRGPGERARTLLLGSHLDSVPNGGRFDGALGVVAALEVVRTVAEAGLELPVALEAVDFTDEEGTLVGLLGSSALTGALTREVLAEPRGGRAALLAALERGGLTEDDLLAARRDPAVLAGFLELHIEQGPVLEREGAAIGLVTGITGAASFEIELVGEARHAGTTPFADRRDALLGAAACVVGVRELVAGRFPTCVATVGDVAVEPGAFNVVPRVARLKVECRSADPDRLGELEGGITELAGDVAAAHGLDVEVRDVARWEPVATDADVRAAIAAAADALGLRALELTSGAGHDTQALARVTPSGMLFVPSKRGISHDPAEETPWEQCVAGANVLLGATVTLARAAR